MRRVFADHFRASTPPVPGRYALWAVIGDAEELLVGRFTVGDANACEREAERLRVRAVEEDARDPDAALQALRRAVLLSPRAPTRRHYVAAVVTHAIALREQATRLARSAPRDALTGTLQARRWLLRAYADLGHMPAPLRDEIDRNLRQRNALVARALQRWQVGQ